MFVVCLSLCPVVYSKEVLDVYVEHLPPNAIITADGYQGVAIDILTEVSALSGYQLKMKKAPWVRAYHEGVNKPNIIFTGLNRIPEREHKFHWLLQLGHEKQFIWALKGTSAEEFKVGKYAFAKSDHKITQFKKYAKSNDFGPNIHLVTTREQAVKMLFAGRVDYIVGSAKYLQSRTAELGLEFEQLKTIVQIDGQNRGLYLALSKLTKPIVITNIKKAIKKLDNKGAVLNIKNRWHEKAQHQQ